MRYILVMKIETSTFDFHMLFQPLRFQNVPQPKKAGEGACRVGDRRFGGDSEHLPRPLTVADDEAASTVAQPRGGSIPLNAADHSPSPQQIPLLGIAYRKIAVHRTPIAMHHARKTTARIERGSLGNQLRSKRIAKGIQEFQLAGILGVATRLVKDWEANLSPPSPAVLAILAEILALTKAPKTTKSTAE